MTDVCGGGVIMRDFKIRIDGLLDAMTGFQALCPKKIDPAANNSAIVLCRSPAFV